MKIHLTRYWIALQCTETPLPQRLCQSTESIFPSHGRVIWEIWSRRNNSFSFIISWYKKRGGDDVWGISWYPSLAKKAAKTSFSLLPLSSLPSLLTIISPTIISTFFSQLLVTPWPLSASLSSPAPVSFSSHQTSSNASRAVGKGQAGKCLPQCGNVSFLCAFALLHFCIFAHLILTPPNPHC